MTPTTKKTADEAGTSTTGNQSIPKTLVTGYMHRRSRDNGHSYGTWSGEQLSFEDHTTVVVRWDALADASANGSATLHVDQSCVEGYNAHFAALRAEEEAEAKRKAERDSAEREEVELIERITGMDLYPGDLPFMILEYRREGKDFTKLLDAMQAVDDLELSRAGRTSWDYDPEMDDPA